MSAYFLMCVEVGLGPQPPSRDGRRGGTSHAGTMPAGMEAVYIKGWHSVRKEYRNTSNGSFEPEQGVIFTQGMCVLVNTMYIYLYRYTIYLEGLYASPMV